MYCLYLHVLYLHLEQIGKIQSDVRYIMIVRKTFPFKSVPPRLWTLASDLIWIKFQIENLQGMCNVSI